MSSERFWNVAVAALTLCALVTTGLVVRREFFSPRPAAASLPAGAVRIPTWERFAREGHRMGPAQAPVTIVVFSDFQCPYCAILMDRLRTLRQEHPADVSVVYRHFPVEGHRFAVAAARASECADAQGRFEAFHDALFNSRESIGMVPWDRFATAAGVPDLARFRACAADTGPVPALARDTMAANNLYVRGTPTLLINGQRLQGALPMDTLEAFVRSALHPSAPSRS
ncbi:MAG TPA: DsbA family protein [Longimicrobium sp.]